MRKKLNTQFNTRQYMVSRDFEIYYYKDQHMKKVANHIHDYYEIYFFLEGDVSLEIEKKRISAAIRRRGSSASWSGASCSHSR